ncbi:MAG: D-alanine--D-alanine ligase [Candidatus Brocadiia bacterium]
MTSISNNTKVAVLMGGVSNEREISFKSGKAIATALQQTGYEVEPVDITDREIEAVEKVNPGVAFVALHGEFGEDGQVQQMLDRRGIPYTGSGPIASRAGMDKVASKRLFTRHSVPTADYAVISPETEAPEARRLADGLGYPLVCKPAVGGSSLGINVVDNGEDLPEAIAAARDSGPVEGDFYEEPDNVMLEKCIHGREFTVGVLDGRPLPVVEVRSEREFFDFEAKYSADDTEYIIPVAVLETVYRRMQEAAMRAYNALGCRHLARVDMMHGYDGQLYVLEVNTIPGFTPRSLLPMAADYAGIDFHELCDRLCGMALRDGIAGSAPAERQSA